jgi:hypothetical protein
MPILFFAALQFCQNDLGIMQDPLKLAPHPLLNRIREYATRAKGLPWCTPGLAATAIPSPVVGRVRGHPSATATTPQASPEKQVVIFPVALAERLLAGDVVLNRLKRLWLNDGWHGDRDPLLALTSLILSPLAAAEDPPLIPMQGPGVGFIPEDRIDG